ncbi:hypothetical protein J2TS4_18890 [Paenibacillus sp. J2TS4]|nr:hypothetical protein J2TS4_18890 [Paenibacillus sp. J2TS4]
MLPVIFLCTVAILFFCLFMYQKAALFHSAAVSADRTAAHWDNSYKDPISGAYPLDKNDGLYWRVFNDQASDLLGLLGLGNPAVVALPAEASAKGSGPVRKLTQAAQWLPETLEGELSYSNRGLDRTVQVKLGHALKIPSIVQNWFAMERAAGASSAQVTDPVEWIRAIDLTRSYLGRIKGKISTEDVKKSWPESVPDPPKLDFNSEKEASEYLRELVNGKSVRIDTNTVGKYRIIDALDRDGVAHEVKYNVNYKDAKDQIKKDVELMERGEVKGVVWHFFRINKKGRNDLTPALRKELEQNGIVVIIHN